MKKKENTEKSLLCAFCPYAVKKKITDYQPEYKKLQWKTPAQYHKSVSVKNKTKQNLKNHIGLQTEHVCDNTNFILNCLYFQLAG